MLALTLFEQRAGVNVLPVCWQASWHSSRVLAGRGTRLASLVKHVAVVLGEDALVSAAESAESAGETWLAACRWAAAAHAAEVAAEEKWAGSTEAAAAAVVRNRPRPTPSLVLRPTRVLTNAALQGGQGGEASGEDGAAKAANPTGDAPTGAEPAAAAAAAAPMAGAGPMDVAGD